jgi:alpha-beta hydrolase superfamily lysophospholipase
MSSAWLKLYEEPSFIDVALATVMSFIYPKFSQNSKIDAYKLSNIKQLCEDYIADPLNHSLITAGLFKSFHASGLWAISHASELRTPVYVLHGADDHLISPSGSREFAAGAGAMVTLKIYPSTLHEPHNDLVCDEVLGDVSRWISLLN